MTLPKFNIIRIPISFFLLFVGTAISCFDNMFAYFIAFTLCSIGGWIFSNNLNRYFRGGLLWLIVGFPIFLYSLTAHAYWWLSYLEADKMEIFIAKFASIVISSVLYLMVFENE